MRWLWWLKSFIFVGLNIHQHPSTSINIHQHPSTSTNIHQHPSTSMSFGTDHFRIQLWRNVELVERTILLTSPQCFSMANVLPSQQLILYVVGILAGYAGHCWWFQTVRLLFCLSYACTTWHVRWLWTIDQYVWHMLKPPTWLQMHAFWTCPDGTDAFINNGQCVHMWPLWRWWTLMLLQHQRGKTSAISIEKWMPIPPFGSIHFHMRMMRMGPYKLRRYLSASWSPSLRSLDQQLLLVGANKNCRVWPRHGRSWCLVLIGVSRHISENPAICLQTRGFGGHSLGGSWWSYICLYGKREFRSLWDLFLPLACLPQDGRRQAASWHAFGPCDAPRWKIRLGPWNGHPLPILEIQRLKIWLYWSVIILYILYTDILYIFSPKCPSLWESIIHKQH